MANLLVRNNFYQGTSGACIVDLTPPTFAGIASLSVQSRGQIRATWLAASDPTLPIRYEIYIQASTATGLFNTTNIIAISDKLQYDTFTMPDGSFLVNGTTYYVGVRAIDGVNNRDSNVVSLNVISTGVSVAAEEYAVSGALSFNSSNQMVGTFWGLKNSVLATTSNAVLGTASYVIYDKSGNLVSGMSQSGITAGTDGQYIITPVNSTLSESLDQYLVKVTISIDGANRVGYVPIVKEAPQYDIQGSFFVDTANNLDGNFWITANEKIVTSGLGTASFQVYDSSGAPVSGMSGSGLTADIVGIFHAAGVASTLNQFQDYVVIVTINVNGVVRSDAIAIFAKTVEFDVQAGFSINGSNQLRATFWVESNGVVQTGAALGAANYQIYDASGTAIVGLSQTGITADSNGRYQITPVSAALLVDLSHYSVKVGAIVNGVERVAYHVLQPIGN